MFKGAIIDVFLLTLDQICNVKVAALSDLLTLTHRERERENYH